MRSLGQYFLEMFCESGCGIAWQWPVCLDTLHGKLLAPVNHFTCAATCVFELALFCQVVSMLITHISVHLCFSLLLSISLFPTVVKIGRGSWKDLKEFIKRFRGDHKILEDIKLVGSSLILRWVRKWMLMLPSSNDSLFFLSSPEGTEFLPTRGENRDKRRFTGKHLRQKKNQKVGWGWSLF